MIHDDFLEGGFVETYEWKPKHKAMEFPSSFVRWIDSINSGWLNRITYKPFELYKKQAEQWIGENDDISNYRSQEQQEDYILQEYRRCRDNTLYFANKYGWIKEGQVAGGKLKYKAWEAQEVLLFLYDCGYSCMIGKARQIGFTTTMGLAGMKSINFNNSFYVKFIANNLEKGKEIFRDKIKWGFSKSVPDWLRFPAHNYSGTAILLGEVNRKAGKMDGAESMMEVDTPVVDAINGGSPNVCMIDEIGLIDGIFGLMMAEGRPTLYFFNPETQRMEFKRQLFCWGTGGEMKKGGAVFESEFKASLARWKDKDFSYGVIPVFFDVWARKGMTKEIFDDEKKTYYSKTGPDKEEMKIKFHQHFPVSIDDMFLRSENTIIEVSECNNQILKINRLKGIDAIQYGFFNPVYDMNIETPQGHLPYKLIGADWVPTEGLSDARTTTCIFRHPPQGEIWKYRYYAGTDPINSETGHSKMSTAIWDAYENTISAATFYRVKDYKESFLQSTLLCMYYDKEFGTGVPELLESNIGDAYLDFKEMIGYGRNLVSNNVLAPYLRGGSGKWWGISNKANTAAKITNQIIEMVTSYKDQIYIPWLFIQLKTFVEKDLSGSSTSRQTRFQAADMRYDFDDLIFSSTFAYINAKSHGRYDPELINAPQDKKKVIKKYVQNAETNWNLRLAEVDSNGKVLRLL